MKMLLHKFKKINPSIYNKYNKNRRLIKLNVILISRMIKSIKYKISNAINQRFNLKGPILILEQKKILTMTSINKRKQILQNNSQ